MPTAILRGQYPLWDTVSLNSGRTPTGSVTGFPEKLAARTSRGLRIVRHDGSDVKAPWELSRLQFSPVLAKA